MKLPLDCTVDYLSNFLSTEESEELYATLIDQYRLSQARLIIKAGDNLIETDSYKILFLTEELIRQNSYPETVHGKSHVWSGPLARLRTKVEQHLDKTFEVAMCLYYPDGSYFAPYHSDQETSGVNTILPSISLGAVREFSFKSKSDEEDGYSLDLANGSLLVMGAYCQSRYVHSLPRNPEYKHGRINITFREPAFK
ncbi:alpha-ketoglutarate-dependent dioxygenase AlkB [Neolewinella aurantiaca]|uniref:Alpha-ketoglutarate-dependent dioxygenase AlkB n=1 Tax=Neolewinella aurantiaca TaxID=2602767 RepID=A0A5C7FYP7_9BACT|nr:alpha-ketoglutarate-dependent dioxygenase AlkB [Neolewinella aurantiaca]TXF91736.1 alpha-ketoglutarate-dependent dioxygenase AlkB [Neolewinella aurantiaca]